MEQTRLESRHEEAGELMQFSAGGHVLGFGKGKMLVAAADHALRIEFIDARPVSPVHEGTFPDGKDNRPAAATLVRVTYSDLWDGVDLAYENHASGVIKSTYTIRPAMTGNANPAERIRLRYNVPVAVEKNGTLVISYETGRMIESPPLAWQDINGKRRSIDVSFQALSDREVGFKIGAYDRHFPLVIDPVLSWNTFLGGGSEENCHGMVMDASGNIYVAGESHATWGSPVNPFAGGIDAFVAKLSSSGVLIWHTFMGTSGNTFTWQDDDFGYDVDVDLSGNVFVAGYSYATWGSPINPHAGGYADAFVAKLNSSGVLQWHTFMGSTENDKGKAIALDGIGNIYMAGESFATWGTPINPHAGGWDASVTKLNASGIRQWHTFMGSASQDNIHAMAADAAGNVHVAGESHAAWGSPVNAYAGAQDAFAAKLNTSGVRQWHTFMGSGTLDRGLGLAVDSLGSVYVTGDSLATWGSPVGSFTGGRDAFVAKLSSIGALQWHTFMGGPLNDYGYGLAVDALGFVYVAGGSFAAWGAPINPYAGNYDAFAVKLNSIGIRQWNTFLGTSSFDGGGPIALDANEDVYLAGTSNATWGSPASPYAGGMDVFVAKLGESVASVNIFDGHDFLGNGMSDISVWKPSNGRWYIKGGSWPFWGGSGDTPVNGDYNGDGTTDIAVWKSSNGRWYIKGQAWPFWGGSGDIPAPADYDGNGITDIAVWRPANGRWYIEGQSWPIWGASGDIPVPGDYDGDNAAEVAVWRPSSGNWYINGVGTINLGQQGDIPVPGDYDGDNTTEAAVWRPSDGKWYIQGMTTQTWGQSGDIPVPGDFNGDGITDVAVFRPSNGRWYIKGQAWPFWGGSGDIPLVR